MIRFSLPFVCVLMLLSVCSTDAHDILTPQNRYPRPGAFSVHRTFTDDSVNRIGNEDHRMVRHDYPSRNAHPGPARVPMQPHWDRPDSVSDKDPYRFPGMIVKPRRYWSCVGVLGIGSRNRIGETEETRGLPYHLLAQSVAGLTNRAVQQGRSEVAVWFHDHGDRASYRVSKQALHEMGIVEQGMLSAIDLARNEYGPADGIAVQIKDLFDGYVLTDVASNPESGIVATVASSVCNGIIVDVRDQAQYDRIGYRMLYDARRKTTVDAWHEFRDRVSNQALVVMPVQTGELRDFAIMHNLFVVNINHVYNQPTAGQNLALFEEILRWLQPGAPIYGWEQGIDESLFVDRASRTGHVWVPSDWCYNLPLTSLLYRERQQPVLANTINPHAIDWNKDRPFVSFYLTDGDNVQWMTNGFVENFYRNADAVETKMGFGLPVSNLNQMYPALFNRIIHVQPNETTVIEALGGGYQYVDNYGQEGHRGELLADLANRVAHHMRRHRIQVLGLMARDVKSPNAMAGYQAFIDANDQLNGIIVLQYAPYAGGGGEIFWLTNRRGFDIPVVTVRYTLWNFGAKNHEREGTPAYIAQQLKQQAHNRFSVIAVHAWSNFRDTGNSLDLLGENKYGNLNGASAARLLMNHLGDTVEIVNPQELIWRIRMHYRPEQTMRYLNRDH